MAVSPSEGQSPRFHKWFAASWHSSLGAPCCEHQSVLLSQPQPDPQQIEHTPWVIVAGRGRCPTVGKNTYPGHFPAGVYKELPERSKARKVKFKWMKRSVQGTAHWGGKQKALFTCSDHDIATSHCAPGFPACFASHDGKRFHSSRSIFTFYPHVGSFEKKNKIKINKRPERCHFQIIISKKIGTNEDVHTVHWNTLHLV